MEMLKDWVQAIHENAVDHGWWKEQRPVEEIIALIHSEWSAALKEYRAGRSQVWYQCDATKVSCQGCNSYDIAKHRCKRNKRRPEGISVELIDGCIMILDYVGATEEEVNEKTTMNEAFWNEGAKEVFNSLPELVTALHYITAVALRESVEKDDDELVGICLMACLPLVGEYIRKQGYDPMEVLREKHEYNKTRPCRHGGKVC